MVPSLPPGYLFSDQPSCRHLPGGPCGEGVTERHHTLCRAIHQDLRHQQGPLPLLFTSPQIYTRGKQQHAFQPDVLCLPFPSWIDFVSSVRLSRSAERSEGAQGCQADMPTLGPVQDAICLGCQVRQE